MTFFVYLPLLLPVLVALAARPLAERARPRPAVLGLVTAAVLTAAGTVWSLLLLILTLFDDLPAMIAANARHGMRLPEPVPDQIALAAAALLTWALIRLARDLHRRHDTVRRLRNAGPGTDGVVIADWSEPLAVAVPGRPGDVLLTTGMLRLLTPAERRAVIAHERAHLAHRHHTAVLLAGAAAAVNPLLRPVRETVTYLVERWADEDAARTVGDRTLVARAVARAALATAHPTPTASLGMHGGVIVRRVRALQGPEPATTRRLHATLAGATVVVAGCALAIAVATADFLSVLSTWTNAP
ncbi:M56 family metallopeptidase [Paractinoplanes rishiriensis]|uniref:Peptidase M48 n=1 Tax=Paractinoplanes rishiriensis TaxID=1050105 RepID=A0A919K468_9ACTN|nr:M56 family metallopeptidase [Actinoplanes rishiriensis]GIE98464.1 peptidase M48 [Actinoplanes rishiriensis]